MILVGHSHPRARDMGLVWVCAHRRARVEDCLYADTLRPAAERYGRPPVEILLAETALEWTAANDSTGLLRRPSSSLQVVTM